MLKRTAYVLLLAATLLSARPAHAGDPISFTKSQLQNIAPGNPTTLQFGPDDRLYIGRQDGLIDIIDVVRNAPGDYEAASIETLTQIREIQNHNDDGSLNPTVNRLITGLLVVGTSSNPVVYVSSSDWRIAVGVDSGLDTNSSTISRLTWTGKTWDHLELVRGLPRCEENHASNGMVLDAATNTLYVASGGNTNMGAPSNNFAFLPEYALSAAILSIDLDAIGDTTYDLPTLDDPTRPNTGPGGADQNDPFGGNDGLNQAIVDLGGPVQVYATGLRNAYDIVLTDDGRMYTVDNGPNAGWGGPPVMNGGDCTNQSNDSNSQTYHDSLHFIDGPDYYGGHPNPTRADTSNTFGGQSPVPFDNPIECDYFVPGVNNWAIWTWNSSTNGLVEYTADNFGGAMQGDLLAAGWNSNSIQRVTLNAAGDDVVAVQTLFANVGGTPLDVTAQGTGAYLAGTIWVADHQAQKIWVFEPSDLNDCTALYDDLIDEDSDGYSNADEIDNNSDPCSQASVPADFDGDLLSDLNDPDDDNDGVDDMFDSFQRDATDGAATRIPLRYDWGVGDPGFGFFGLGFTGLMRNGVDDYLDLYDPTNLTAGGAAGKLTIDAVPPGDAFESLNDQEYAFQFGVDVEQTTDPFVVRTQIDAPFFDGAAPTGSQSVGVYFGVGDQDNYVKFVLAAGGFEFLQEDDGIAVATTFSANVLNANSVTLAVAVNPDTGTVQAQYATDNGPEILLGQPIAIGGDLLATLQGADSIAVGLIATSRGGPPFTATWDYIEVQSAGSNAMAYVEFNTPGPIGQASTYDPDSIQVRNDSLGGEQISRVTIDIGTAILPDVAFDPNGAAGDVIAKDFTPDSGEAQTGLTSHQFAAPHDGGFDRLVLDFDDFDPGELFTFSVDIDPTSIQGSPQMFGDHPGAVSGFELIRSTITFEFSDGTVLTGEPFRTGASGVLSENEIKPDPPAAPLLSVVDVPSTPAIVGDPQQTLSISGSSAAEIVVLVCEGVLDVNGVPGGGFDLDPFEMNRIVAITEYVTMLDLAGNGTLPITLLNTKTEGGLNYIVAVEREPDGRTGFVSDTIILELGESELTASPAAVDFGAIVIDQSSSMSVTITNLGDIDISIQSVSLTGDPDFTISDVPATPILLAANGASINVELGFLPLVVGEQSATLVVDHHGIASPLNVPLSGQALSEPTNVLYRVNAGGPLIAAPDGSQPDWAEDQPLSGPGAGTAQNGTPSPYVNSGSLTFGSSTPVTLDGSVPLSAPNALFQTERWDPEDAPEMQWDFPIASPMTVEVRLYFAEIFGGTDDPGDRVFDVLIENRTVLQDFDQVVEAGFRVGFVRSFVVNVTDGILDIDFVHGLQEQPAIKAIEIVRGAPNDNCDDALAISLADSPISISNAAATIDGAAHVSCADFASDALGPDVWYVLTPECSGELTLSTCGFVDFASAIAVYDGADCTPADATLIACSNAGSCKGEGVILTVPVNENDPYLIRVAGVNSESGSGQLHIECNQACIADINADRVVDVFDLLKLLDNWGMCDVPCPPHCDSDINQDCGVELFDLLAMLEQWGACP